ncbi:unnamed protein product [Microthlaspi erraticum]|uniref:F-box domain-containing protein n=1 Tax=Microthlaspi erraticum TaxID=1685480 RepID=A0A6D2J7Q1_9BRAS|nr:unnamed protein product [Microthlaspi erraticum]
MSILPLDVVELILERLPVKSLLRFTCVSKEWRCTITESRGFQERQLIRRQQTHDPDVLLVSMVDASAMDLTNIEALRTVVVGSPVSVKIQTPWENTLYQVCSSSCDGLICLFDTYNSGFVVNPSTRWHRTIPLCNNQLITSEPRKRNRGVLPGHPFPRLGFGKDKLTGIYKPVWLYNSLEPGPGKETTTCEVFDFSANTWRMVIPASPHRIITCQDPIYFDGSLHWFTEGETKVLSLDLHTETFQVICRAPFVHASHLEINLCNLNDRLCVSEMKWPVQKIWSFNADKEETWERFCTVLSNIFEISRNMKHSLETMRLNARLQTFPNTFYFSYATKRTRKPLGMMTVPSSSALYPSVADESVAVSSSPSSAL